MATCSCELTLLMAFLRLGMVSASSSFELEGPGGHGAPRGLGVGEGPSCWGGSSPEGDAPPVGGDPGENPEKARERMAALDHVKKVIYERSRDDWEEFSVLVESGTDTRERLARLAQDEDWPLRRLHRHDATLEDVFVELTRKD